MIEIDHTLLSEEALDNLITEVITRQGTDYGEHELEIQTKKKQLVHNLQLGNAVIVFSSQENSCDIITKDNFLKFSNLSV
ncbi:MAG: YheU family protein [Legionella sp.]|uniref:YheU family protein n=1 Tax=Legionella sp. TaxID=459 RepID=UPI00283C5009|nr:YheU family protein [Legionella sp.]